MADTTQEAVQQVQPKGRTEPPDEKASDAPQGSEGGSEATKVNDGPAEKAEGEINPSSPGNTGTTPGSNAKLG